MTTTLDAYQAIDEIVMAYRAGTLPAERAMEYISDIIDTQDSKD